jgi:hypothetical protein
MGVLQFGYPRQYRQKGTEVGQVIDKFNFASRMALAWALPFLFSKPAALLVYEGVSPEDHSNPSAYDSLYQNVLVKAHRTTALLWGLAAILLLVATKLLRLW